MCKQCAVPNRPPQAGKNTMWKKKLCKKDDRYLHNIRFANDIIYYSNFACAKMTSTVKWTGRTHNNNSNNNNIVYDIICVSQIKPYNETWGGVVYCIILLS